MGDVSQPASLYAVLIPAISGLAGTILGVLANGVSAKWSDERKLAQERERAADQEKHQVRILRAVLRAELRSMLGMFASERDFAADTGNAWTNVPVIGYFKTLQKDLNVVGILEPAEAEAVMTAYYVYLERTSYIRTNGARTTGEKTGAPDELISYRLDDAALRGFLVNDLDNIIGVTRAALLVLGGVGDAATPSMRTRLDLFRTMQSCNPHTRAMSPFDQDEADLTPISAAPALVRRRRKRRTAKSGDGGVTAADHRWPGV